MLNKNKQEASSKLSGSTGLGYLWPWGWRRYIPLKLWLTLLDHKASHPRRKYSSHSSILLHHTITYSFFSNTEHPRSSCSKSSCIVYIV
jgi:hypothetical protein